MLKVETPDSNVFHNFKCGEIFCISSAVFNVTCCLCAVKIHLDQFPSHFQMQHLALVEERINLEELENKNSAKPTVDENILEIVCIKEEDPIKHEDVTDCIGKDNKILKLLGKTENTEHTLENQQQSAAVEAKIDDLNISENLKVGSLKKKKNTKNSRRSKNNARDLKAKRGSKKKILELERNDPKESKEEISDLEPNKEEDDNFKDSDDDVKDRDWLEEDKALETESELGSEDNFKDELPYPCHICQRSFRTKHGLLKHNQIVHNPKKPPKPKEPKVIHKCEECNKVFRIARDLQGHKWKHTGIFCDICGKRFTQTGNMMRHKQRHTGIKDHKCEECGKAFFTEKELKSHIICHTGLMPVICEICGKQCRHRGVLTAHMRRHTGERPAKCNVCGKCFFSIHDLNVHAVAHTSERPFKCDICGSTFQRRKALRVHKLIHSKDRKHVCKICGKGFAQSGGLKSHMRSHDTALEKAAMEPVQQTVVTSMFNNSVSVVVEKQSALNPPTCTTTNEVSMPSESSLLEEFMA